MWWRIVRSQVHRKKLGCFEGDNDGACDGSSVGEVDGKKLGIKVGLPEGIFVGIDDGFIEGWKIRNLIKQAKIIFVHRPPCHWMIIWVD